MDLARGRRVASRSNQIVRALQGSMDSLTHDAYLERRELAWRTAGVVPDGAYSMVVLDGACGTRGSLWSVTGVGACAWCTAWRHQGMQRYAINSGRGPHTLLGEHFEWEGLINCLKDCLRRCTGLGASQGSVQGVSRFGGSSRECSKSSAGGLIRGGTCTRRGFECISVAAQARWRSGQDGGTR